jgi:hypothetical protein
VQDRPCDEPGEDRDAGLAAEWTYGIIEVQCLGQRLAPPDSTTISPSEAKNWPLAAFYLDEARSHLKWAVRVRPVRQTSAGQVDLRSILDGLDRSLLPILQKTVEARDPGAFSKAYPGHADRLLRVPPGV